MPSNGRKISESIITESRSEHRVMRSALQTGQHMTALHYERFSHTYVMDFKCVHGYHN